MFETGSYKSLPKHIALYEALEASIERAQRDEFLAKKDKSQDTNFAYLPKIKQRPEWLKPIPDDERPATPEPAWVIPTSHIPDAENNWANALASTYQAPTENSLLEKTRDLWMFMNWYCQKIGKTKLTQADLEDQIDWANPEGDQVRIDISKPRPLSGLPGHGSRQALSISKIKAAYYHDFGLELLVPEHMWIVDVCTYDISASYGISHWWFIHHKFYIDRHIAESSLKVVRTHMRVLSVVRIKAYSRYRYCYLKEITLRIVDHQEYTIAEKDFKNLYPSDFEDLNLLLLQGHLNHLLGSDIRMLSTDTKLSDSTAGFEFKHEYAIIDSPRVVVFPVSNNERKIMRFNEVYKFSDGTLTNIIEALDYRVKEYKVNRLNSVDIEKVAVRSSLRSLKPKRTIESRAKRSSINLIRTLFHITCSSHNVKTKVIIRVLRIILVVLPEHPSDAYVFTMKMEILLEPTTNKLMVQVKMEMEIPPSATLISKSSRSDQVLKLKELQERRIIKLSPLRKENVDYQSSERHSNLRILKYLKLYFFEYEHVAVNSTRHGLDTATIRKPTSLGRIQKNLLDRVSQLHYPFSLSECLKADNTVRVNWISIVTVNTVRYHSDVLAISQG
ncbi:hypothetical protein Tco_0930486 [Tanacetum coccineum]